MKYRIGAMSPYGTILKYMIERSADNPNFELVVPDGITNIRSNFCRSLPNLSGLILPSSITSIGEYAFGWCSNLVSIQFRGTKSEWNSITKGEKWNYNIGTGIVSCSDGTVTL